MHMQFILRMIEMGTEHEAVHIISDTPGFISSLLRDGLPTGGDLRAPYVTTWKQHAPIYMPWRQYSPTYFPVGPVRIPVADAPDATVHAVAPVAAALPRSVVAAAPSAGVVPPPSDASAALSASFVPRYDASLDPRWCASPPPADGAAAPPSALAAPFPAFFAPPRVFAVPPFSSASADTGNRSCQPVAWLWGRLNYYTLHL